MFGRTRYIDWAFRLYGNVKLDLATSGIPLASWSDLGVPVPTIDDPTGYARLREAIARYNQVPVEEVRPALGTSGALFFAYATIASVGDEILVEAPGYEPLTRAAEGIGAIVRTYERRAEENFRVVPERIAAQITPKTRAIVVTNLHNPTGVRVPDATLRELALVAEARGAHLIVDEVYAPFDDLPDDGIFRTSARKLAPNVITVASLTKCYGLGMHRIGWMLGPPDVIERAEATVISTTGHMPLTHANLATAAFGAIGALARRSKSLAAEKRAIADAWARTLPHATWSAPAEGLFGLVTIPSKGDITPAIEALAKEHGVLVGAGAFFGIPNGFRLSWATLPKAQFEEGLALLSPLVSG